ncbi:MAG: UDP-N-acetylmuramoyl-L-alanine--D-glutamate ligase [Deltaproteobacteria bacterium]|jgi:UDP-N-acetylmuramoylalanine--D-glutamate ligase|nr:UDP-N-acetylmuramoyl-L-alanine--D-glutamate ligase [Deltaproteobacteria bacterium]
MSSYAVSETAGSPASDDLLTPGSRRLRPGLRCLTVGAGLSGLAAAELLVALQAQVLVVEKKPLAELAAEKARLAALGVELAPEAGAERLVGEFDLAVLSPGAPWDHCLAVAFRAAGKPVWGELELSARHQSRPVLAVTGSNGKSSVTDLTGLILERAGLRPFVGGNIGRPLAELAAAEVRGAEVGGAEVRAAEGSGAEGAAGPLWAVLEVSSFQLETVEAFHAVGAAFLNFTPDHLDRHGDLPTYLAAKRRIFNRQTADDFAVVNLDDPLLGPPVGPARVFGFSLSRRPDFGAWVADGVIRVVDGPRLLAEAPWSGFQLRGAHNQENVMAAVGLALRAGVAPAAALAAAADFRPADHRLQLVGVYEGVSYVDDSKGTNVGAVQRALETVEGRCVLLMGGRDKNLDFGLLAPVTAEKARLLIAFGECRAKIVEELGAAVETLAVETLEQAVAAAREAARPGETVLLSPACTSFDAFENYKRRGEAFAAEARRLHAAGAGSPR